MLFRSNVPVDAARQLGATLVIAVNVSPPPRAEAIDNLFDIILQATNIMSNEVSQSRLKGADVVIEPAVGKVGFRDFSKKKELMLSGMKAAEEAIPRIRVKITEQGRRS